MRALFIVLMLLLAYSCKTIKHIKKVQQDRDSVLVKHKTTIAHFNKDTISFHNIDTTAYNKVILTYDLDTLTHIPYIKKKVIISLKRGNTQAYTNVTSNKVHTTLYADSLTVRDSIKEVKRDVIKKGISWWYWLFIIPVVLVVVVVKKYWAKIRAFIKLMP